MRKLLVAFIALAAISLTAQDVYRLNDSTFVYPCLHNDTTTSYNFVGLPLQTDWTMASDFDPSGTNIDAISRYDINKQSWFTAGHHPAFGWLNDFPVETGGAYLISAKNNFDFIVTGDSVRVFYGSIARPYATDMTIVLPLTEPDITSTLYLGNELRVAYDQCNSMSKFRNDLQKWYSTIRSP